MRYLPAFVAATVLAFVLGIVGTLSLRAALNPSAEMVFSNQSEEANAPLYGAR